MAAVGTLDLDRVIGVLVRYLGAADERIEGLQALSLEVAMFVGNHGGHPGIPLDDAAERSSCSIWTTYKAQAEQGAFCLRRTD